MKVSYQAVYYLLERFPRRTLKAYLEKDENQVALEAGKLIAAKLGDGSFEHVLIDEVDSYDKEYAVFITKTGILTIAIDTDLSLSAMALLYMKLGGLISYEEFESTIEAQAGNKLEDVKAQLKEFCVACDRIKGHFQNPEQAAPVNPKKAD